MAFLKHFLWATIVMNIGLASQILGTLALAQDPSDTRRASPSVEDLVRRYHSEMPSKLRELGSPSSLAPSSHPESDGTEQVEDAGVRVESPGASTASPRRERQRSSSRRAEDTPPSITPIKQGKDSVPTFEGQFRLQANGKEVIVGQRLLDLILGRSHDYQRIAPTATTEIARHVTHLETLADPIARVVYIADIYRAQSSHSESDGTEQVEVEDAGVRTESSGAGTASPRSERQRGNVTWQTLVHIVAAYRNGYSMRQAQTLAKMLTAQDPDPQAILTLLRETLANRPKTEVL